MVSAFASPTTSCRAALPLICWGGTSKSLDLSGNKLDFATGSDLLRKRHIQACLKVLPRQLNNGKPRQLNGRMNIVKPDIGRTIEGGITFQQDFTVRSFEIGSDSKISFGALINYLQEASLNHLKILGILADGFGSTLKMAEEDLIWVICWSQFDVDYYPSWDDVVQLKSWMYRTGKNGFRRDWHIKDLKTGRTVIRATSKYAMMNKKTRKLFRATEEATGDMTPYLSQCEPIVDKDSKNLVTLDTDNSDYVRTGLTPGWTDMDVNQHVNHVKLINFVLESVPRSVVGGHELSSMTLEYRKECHWDNVLQSLSRISSDSKNRLTDDHGIEFDHLLRLENGSELVRGRTKWRPNVLINSEASWIGRTCYHVPHICIQ